MHPSAFVARRLHGRRVATAAVWLTTTLLVASTPAASAASKGIPGLNAPAPGEVPHVEGSVNLEKFSLRAPVSLQEAAASLKYDDRPMVAKWGLSSVFDRRGFHQLVIRPDRSAFIIKVALPDSVKEVRVGSWPIGGPTIENTREGSNEGWSSKCPPPERDNAHVIVAHYAAPVSGEPSPFRSMGPAGEATKTFESHLTFPQVDTGTLEITRVDRTGRIGHVEGRVSGQVSHITTLRQDMDADEACKRGNYAVETEPFELTFALELIKGY